MTEIGTIPQSPALAEAKIGSISQFMSRNPHELGPAERKEMVRLLREQRARWAIAEAAGKPARAKKEAKASLETTKTLSDLGL